MRQSRLFILLCFLIACSAPEDTDPYTGISDPFLRGVIKKSIDRAGGWEQWDALHRISYEKRTVLYDSTGNVESQVKQVHRYDFQPQLKMSISWEQGRDHCEIRLRSDQVQKWVNGERVPADSIELKKTCMSALFVLGMPFKLLDQGAQLGYNGKVRLVNGKDAHAVTATYEPDGTDPARSNEEWAFYFDAATYDFLASRVDHGNYIAMIYNDEVQLVDGLRFPKTRTSFRVNAEGDHLWKRGTFDYDQLVLE